MEYIKVTATDRVIVQNDALLKDMDPVSYGMTRTVSTGAPRKSEIQGRMVGAHALRSVFSFQQNGVRLLRPCWSNASNAIFYSLQKSPLSDMDRHDIVIIDVGVKRK